MRKLINILFFTLAVIAFTACHTDEPSIPMKSYKVKLNLGIPVDDSGYDGQNRKHAPRRLGDPGTYENFLYPRYMYLYYVWERKSDSNIQVKVPEGIITVGSNRLMTLDPDAWTNGVYSGNLQYTGDSIFTYNGEVEMVLPENISQYNVRVYVAMSYDQLANLYRTDVATETQVQNLTFDLDNDSLISRLQHIYSSPYNYEVDGKYYGTLKASGKNMYLNMLLYHVAAKVDLIWNVPDEQQANFNIKQITAQQLYKKSSYIFRPNENEGKPSLPSESYDLRIKSEDDVAMQYKGRYYFYTIPYYYTVGDNKYFDIVLNTNFDNGEDNVRNLTLQKKININQPFVPWIRGNLQFTTMPTVNQVKIVD